MTREVGHHGCGWHRTEDGIASLSLVVAAHGEGEHVLFCFVKTVPIRDIFLPLE